MRGIEKLCEMRSFKIIKPSYKRIHKAVDYSFLGRKVRMGIRICSTSFDSIHKEAKSMFR